MNEHATKIEFFSEDLKTIVEQLKVSKLIKNYLLSISNETKDNFKDTLKAINERTIEEVFKTPLQSSNLIIRDIMKIEMEKFIDKLTDTLKYYTKGIFYSGKVSVRKKMKLSIDKTKKYDFSQSDRFFIDNYLTQKMSQFEHMLKYASVGFLVEDITNKIREQWNIETDDDGPFAYTRQELVDDELDELLNIILTITSSVYDEILDASIKEMILLFKRGQIEEYKNLNIHSVSIQSTNGDNCCNVCKVRSNSILDINDLTNDFDINEDIIHPFCKISIEPIINYNFTNGTQDRSTSRINLSEQFNFEHLNHSHIHSDIKKTIDKIVLGKLIFYNVPIEIEERIKKLHSKIKIYLSEFIKPLEFKFVKDVVDTKEWFDGYSKQYIEEGEFKASNKTYIAQDSLRGKISSYRQSGIVFISNFAFLLDNIENVIIREIFRNTTVDEIDWWKVKYEEGIKEDKMGEGLSLTKSVFVNFLSRISLESFILESIVFYINDPSALRGIDEEVYYKIKNIFNGIQFF